MEDHFHKILKMLQSTTAITFSTKRTIVAIPLPTIMAGETKKKILEKILPGIQIGLQDYYHALSHSSDSGFQKLWKRKHSE